MNPCRILLVEDNQADAHIVQSLLTRASMVSFFPLRSTVVHAGTLAAALDRFENETFDVILLDLFLPDSHGMDTVEQVLEAAPATPIIVMSGLSDESAAVESVQLGAQDYLVKGMIDPPLLARAIRYAVERKRREREMEVITSISAALRAARSRAEMLPIVVDFAMDLTESQHGTFVLVDPESGENEIVQARGDWVALEGNRLKPGVGVTGWVIRTGETYMTDDLSKDVRLPKLEALHQLKAALGIPLRDQDGIIGALWVGRSHDVPHAQRAYTPEDERLLTLVCDVAANAIRRVTLTEQVEAYAQQTQTIMEATDEGLILLDADHRIEVANPAGIEQLRLMTDAHVGDRLEMLCGRPLADILVPAGELPHHELFVEGIESRCFAVSAQPIGDASEPAGWVLSLRDITLIHRMHQMAEQQNRLAAVGHLAAGIAHDFNNILAVITLYADILLRIPDLSPDVYTRLTTISQQAHRATALIRQILDFGRRAIVERTPTNIVPFLEQLRSVWEAMLPETIALSIQPSAEEYIVLMDPSRLQQALTNLLVNSRDAMAEGGRIEIGVDAVYVPPDTRAPVHEMPPGTWLRITVADTGDGIAPDILPHIFEPFYTTKAPGRGSGLGLAQVYGIVRQHDGYITAGNRAEGGAVIRLYLPLVRNPADAERDGLPAGAEITPATVLVIEPNPVTAETISATLSGLGYRVLTVPDGNAAIELAQHLDSHIDLAISHLDPPSDEGDPPSDEVADTEGLDFFHALRALRPNLRLIITHDASFKDVKIDLTEPGIVGRLQKPFTVSDIAAKVASVISPPLRGRRG